VLPPTIRRKNWHSQDKDGHGHSQEKMRKEKKNDEKTQKVFSSKALLFPKFLLQPNPKSQSFSQSYGSILPTSLTHIVSSTRGCSPWRPAAVMGTVRREIG